MLENTARGDLVVLDTLCGWHTQGLGVTLATIVHTYGSAPHEIGALYAINAQGDEVGALAGTCLGAWIKDRMQGARGLRPRIETVSGTDEIFLPCGGRVVFLVENNLGPSHLREWRSALAARKSLYRIVDAVSGEYALIPTPSGARSKWTGRFWLGAYGATWRLLLVGGGAVSTELALMARSLDFAITVSEPRGELRAAFPPGLATVTEAMPDDAVASMPPDCRTAVLALAHDPRLDDLALWEAAPSAAFYVGALGSAATHAKRRARLLGLGVDPAAVARIRGPAGIPINSHTPPEIAVSIAAALVAERRRAPLLAPHSFPDPIDNEVLLHDHRIVVGGGA